MITVLISWPGGSLESALRLGALVLITYALVLWLSAVVWVYRDVRSRTNDQASQLIAVVLVAVFNLPGLMVYLVIRPQSTIDPYERSLESEAVLSELHLMANACQNCRWPIEDDYNVCPHCRVVLREPCRTCGKAVRTSWAACPYCATDRAPPRPQQQPAAAASGESLIPPRRTSPARRPAPPAPASVTREAPRPPSP
jgi:RNA polymerase subunit RPABC4/transcription elongation factor Spt4